MELRKKPRALVVDGSSHFRPRALMRSHVHMLTHSVAGLFDQCDIWCYYVSHHKDAAAAATLPLPLMVLQPFKPVDAEPSTGQRKRVQVFLLTRHSCLLK